MIFVTGPFRRYTACYILCLPTVYLYIALFQNVVLTRTGTNIVGGTFTGRFQSRREDGDVIFAAAAAPATPLFAVRRICNLLHLHSHRLRRM